jgi:hypothetical protein
VFSKEHVCFPIGFFVKNLNLLFDLGTTSSPKHREDEYMEVKNSNNHFLLHVATFKNDAEIVKAAIEGGADLDEKNYCYHYSPFWRGYAPPAVTLRSI